MATVLEKEARKIADALWERFASKDAHGYQDLMRYDAFLDAVAVLVKSAKEV